MNRPLSTTPDATDVATGASNDRTASDVYAQFRNSSYFPSLNGIRAICALLVIKEHCLWAPPEPRIVDWGYLGVDMFFVISGFLIVTLLLRERDTTGHISLRQFYSRRTRRIFPIYYLYIAVLFLIAVISYPHSPKTWDLYKWSFPVFLLYLQDLVPVNIGVLFHTWSLAMEEQFYLAWPAIEKYCSRRLVVPILLILILICQFCNFGLLNGPIGALYDDAGAVRRPIFLITFTPILFGVLAAHAMHDPRIGLRLTQWLRNRWTPPVLLGLAALVCQCVTELQGAPRLVVHVLFCLLLVSMIINPTGVFSRTLQSRVMSYLGKISYGIYLYHVMVLWFVSKVAASVGVVLSPAASFVVAIVLTIGVAALSFRYIEAPIIGRRHKQSVAAA